MGGESRVLRVRFPTCLQITPGLIKLRISMGAVVSTRALDPIDMESYLPYSTANRGEKRFESCKDDVGSSMKKE